MKPQNQNQPHSITLFVMRQIETRPLSWLIVVAAFLFFAIEWWPHYKSTQTATAELDKAHARIRILESQVADIPHLLEANEQVILDIALSRELATVKKKFDADWAFLFLRENGGHFVYGAPRTFYTLAYEVTDMKSMMSAFNRQPDVFFPWHTMYLDPKKYDGSYQYVWQIRTHELDSEWLRVILSGFDVKEMYVAPVYMRGVLVGVLAVAYFKRDCKENLVVRNLLAKMYAPEIVKILERKDDPVRKGA